VDVETCSNAPAEEIRLGEGQREIARILAASSREADELAATEEVALGDRAFERETAAAARCLASRIARTDGEFTGGGFNHIHHQHNLIRLRARNGRDVDGLEETETVEPALGARNHDLVEGIALAHVKLAADDIVTRTVVAADFDPLDIGANAFIDGI